MLTLTKEKENDKTPEIQTEKNGFLRISERDTAISALVEHIRKQKLSFFDEASAIERLIRYYGMTQEEAAAKLGKAQSTIANKLRLLRLTSGEREIIMEYNLTERHSRALLKLASPEDRMIILEKIIDEGLNVDKTEQFIDEFIGREHEKQVYKKRSPVFRNVKTFVNSINKAVETMQAAGISATSNKIQCDGYIEYSVRIPINNL